MAAVEFPYPIEFLKKTTLANVIDELTDPERIIDIHDSESIENTLTTMYRHGVTALAMYRMLPEAKREYYAFITVKDIMAYVLFQNKEIEEAQAKFEQQTRQGPLSLECMKMPIKSVLGASAESTVFPILPTSTSLFHAILKMRPGLHHLFVYHPTEASAVQFQTEQKKVFHKQGGFTKGPTVLSQTDILQFLSKSLSSLGEMLNAKAESLVQYTMRFLPETDPNQPEHLHGSRWTGSKMKYALHQPEHLSALNVFKSMFMHRASSLAIVDDHGKLVETLSQSDFPCIAERGIGMLFKPVIEYLRECFEARRSPVFVNKQDTMELIIQKLTEEEIHRAWLVEETSNKPIGCITVSDVLAVLVPIEGDIEE